MRLIVFALLSSFALGAGVTEVKSVYLLPMAGGLEQYLANRLTTGGIFRVVTDPKLADAIFTDQLGEAFEQKLADLYPPPAATSEKEGKEEKDEQPVRHVSAFGRSKGTIFLVDLKSHSVIWSSYQKHPGVAPGGMDRTASQIVQLIKKQQKAK
jgi:hypothetical protein